MIRYVKYNLNSNISQKKEKIDLLIDIICPIPENSRYKLLPELSYVISFKCHGRIAKLLFTT